MFLYKRRIRITLVFKTFIASLIASLTVSLRDFIHSKTILSPHGFTSLPLHSGMFSINRTFVIGLISSIVTAGIGFLVRWMILYYLEYDIFGNLCNLSISLTYFCSLGGIRFVINEYLKENLFMLSTGGNGGSYTDPGYNTTPGGYNGPSGGYNPAPGGYNAGSNPVPGTGGYNPNPVPGEYNPNPAPTAPGGYNPNPVPGEYNPNPVPGGYSPNPVPGGYNPNPRPIAIPGGYNPNPVPVPVPAAVPGGYNPAPAAVPGGYSTNPPFASNSGVYNPNTGTYNPNTGVYNPNTGTYNPNTGTYNPNTGVYNPNTGTYNPNTGVYNPNTGAYNPNTGAYYQNTGTYNPNTGTYNPNTGAYNPGPASGGYNPAPAFGGHNSAPNQVFGGHNSAPNQVFGGHNSAPNSSFPANNYINPPVPRQALDNLVVTADLTNPDGTNPDGAYVAEFNTSSTANAKLFITIDSRQLHGPNGDRYLGNWLEHFRERFYSARDSGVNLKRQYPIVSSIGTVNHADDARIKELINRVKPTRNVSRVQIGEDLIRILKG
jgi:hypothetical protein